MTVAGETFLATMEGTALRHIPARTVFQLDDALYHFSHRVHAFMDREFPGHWIVRGGPFPWSPRSPDLIPLDFFFWGFVKDNVY
jgi:hypothetical protein